MQKKISTILLLAGLFILNSCVSVPEYKDPLNGLKPQGNGTENHFLSGLTLGLIYSQNSQATFAYLKENYELISKPWAMPTMANDLNPERLKRAVRQILDNRFQKVIELTDMSDSRKQSVDAILIIDFQAIAGQSTGSKVSLKQEAIWLDRNGTEIMRADAFDEATVPWPAKVMFGSVSNNVVSQFQQTLDFSSDLQRYAQGAPRLAMQTLQPGPKARPSQAPASITFANLPLDVTFSPGRQNPDDIAVIIGNARYSAFGRDIPDINPAYADAASMKIYATVALGIRPGNVIELRDATSANFVEVFGSSSSHKGQLYDWVRPNSSNVFVYYAGHGAPGREGKSLLVPVDANAQRVDLSGYPLDLLYRNLAKLPARSVTVVLEACFSGASQGGGIITNASPVFLKQKEVGVPKGLTVIAAGRSEQIASWEEDKSNGLFTKYFLKAMSGEADTNGDRSISRDELATYLDRTVTYYARRYYGRDQIVDIHNYRR